jgi:hypothetical protein
MYRDAILKTCSHGDQFASRMAVYECWRGDACGNGPCSAVGGGGQAMTMDDWLGDHASALRTSPHFVTNWQYRAA